MEELVKIIEIPNFIKVKIVKINEKHCAYYVENYSNRYFYVNEDDFLKTYTRDSISFTLSIDIPFTISIINVEHLENAIYKLHKELTKDEIPRAEKGQYYYVIKNDFTVARLGENNDNVDNNYYKNFNYFVSERQAKRFASKLQDALIDLWKEEREKNNCTNKSYDL